MNAHRSITVLGSTGSVGTATLDILTQAGVVPGQVEALVAGRNVDALVQQARHIQPKLAVIADEDCYQALKDGLNGTGIEVAAGEAATLEAAQRPADWVMAAIVGAQGLQSAIKAAERGATVVLANKESLVSAGQVFMSTARDGGATIIPVDSEHNAIFQALGREPLSQVRRLILTASGGPFRNWDTARMRLATPEQAVAHPYWSMGAKISVDSASMMNKGLELLEASVLFGVEEARIDVLVHPQSIVHSLVEYVDGSTLAQMSPPDMRTPIACAWAWPNRLNWAAPALDLTAIGSLTFEAPDEARFPLLALARAVARMGGAAPAVLNAANEIAVQAFLDRRIGFLDIACVVADSLDRLSALALQAPADIAMVLDIDAQARAMAQSLVLQRSK